MSPLEEPGNPAQEKMVYIIFVIVFEDRVRHIFTSAAVNNRKLFPSRSRGIVKKV